MAHRPGKGGRPSDFRALLNSEAKSDRNTPELALTGSHTVSWAQLLRLRCTRTLMARQGFGKQILAMTRKHVINSNVGNFHLERQRILLVNIFRVEPSRYTLNTGSAFGKTVLQ